MSAIEADVDREVRLACVELAVKDGDCNRPLIERAQEIYAFVTGLRGGAPVSPLAAQHSEDRPDAA